MGPLSPFVLPLLGWAAWFAVDQVLIAVVVVVSFRVFHIPALGSTVQPSMTGTSRRKS